jgi:hypothetical protein
MVYDVCKFTILHTVSKKGFPNILSLYLNLLSSWLMNTILGNIGLNKLIPRLLSRLIFQRNRLIRLLMHGQLYYLRIKFHAHLKQMQTSRDGDYSTEWTGEFIYYLHWSHSDIIQTVKMTTNEGISLEGDINLGKKKTISLIECWLYEFVIHYSL